VLVQLLGTSGCHLCDVAERLVRRIAPSLGFAVELVDIANDNALVDEYGMRIPVVRVELKDQSLKELGWPFQEEELIEWLQSL